MKAKKFYNLFSLQKRLFVILLSIIILFVGLFCRLFFIQIINGKELQIKASSQWLRDLPLSSKRGNILDANSVVLASSVTTYDIYVRARNVLDANKLSALLSEKLNLSFDKVYKKVTNTSISESLIKMQVDEQTSLSIINSGLKGVYLSQNVGRVYPFNDLLTQVLGYCSIDNSGQTGIENYYDKFLKGVDGKSLVQANAKGVELKDTLEYYIPSIAGADCKLTVDTQIQLILEKALEQAYEEHKAKGAWGIVLDFETGGILAMSNIPSFDLNSVPRNDLDLLNQLSKNSCVVDVYEPGSTFKIISITAALNEGVTSLEDRFYCSGSCSVDGQKIKCWKTLGHGSQTLVEGFKNSCNCVFVNLAVRLGTQTLYKYLNMFGIGSRTGVDISSESAGIVIKEDNVKNVDLARIGFGQSVAVTPLQLINAVAGIATGGMYTPHLIDEIYTEDKMVYKYQNTRKELNIKQEVIDQVNSMLFNNINQEDSCTFVSGYDVGGKTGTAQIFKDGALAKGKYISSFFGIYPTSQPKYGVIICINEPSNGAYYGGVVAKPVGQQIFSEMFKVKNILPDNLEDCSLKPSVEMPDLVGLSVSEALGKVKSLGLTANVDGEGGCVITQLPLAGNCLFVGDEVLIVSSG